MKNMFIVAALGIFALISCDGKDTQTINDLKTSVINESTASAKYAAFAAKAKEESHDSIAKLFDVISRAEEIHATTFRGILKDKYNLKVELLKLEFKVGTTAENLQAAIDGEKDEIDSTYPKYVADAKKDKVEKAVNAYSWALAGEKKHLPLFSNALESLKQNITANIPSGYVICPICGNVYDSKAVEDKCDLCNTSKLIFINI